MGRSCFRYHQSGTRSDAAATSRHWNLRIVKIVHLVDNMEIGGAEKLIAMLCQWQREQGHDPSVRCLYRIGLLGEQLRKDGFEVALADPSGSGRFDKIYFGLRKLKPDVLHCHNATATILGSAPARFAGVQSIIATRHGIVAPPHHLRRELKFSLASRCCDWIVAVCDQARSNLMAAPFAARAKIVRIYNAVRGLSSAASPRMMKSGFTLVNVARLNWAKDQETLLRAFACAKSRVPDLQLWIVGDGDLRCRLEGLSRELGLSGSVTFFGEQQDVSPFLQGADLFVLSSVTEGVPISLLEALQASLPAVVTNVGGIAEVTRLSEAILSVPPSNPEALAAAIEKMARSRGELPQLGKMARSCYLRNFAFDRMASEYMALYAINGAVPVHIPSMRSA